jgi:hypothetical protein
MFIAFNGPDIITSVATSATKAPVVVPSIGAAAPVLNALHTIAPPSAAIAVTPVFFSVVHDIKRAKEGAKFLSTYSFSLCLKMSLYQSQYICIHIT